MNKAIFFTKKSCAKAARIDNLSLGSDGSIGEKIKDDMLKRFMKIQEPPPAKKVKPLPIPDEKPRKKRGGKRFIFSSNSIKLLIIYYSAIEA